MPNKISKNVFHNITNTPVLYCLPNKLILINIMLNFDIQTLKNNLYIFRKKTFFTCFKKEKVIPEINNLSHRAPEAIDR